MKKWIEELQDQPWSKAKKANDQPGFNWALQKTAEQVCLFLIIFVSSHNNVEVNGIYVKEMRLTKSDQWNLNGN